MRWNALREELLEGMTGVASLDGLPPFLRRLRAPRSFARRLVEVDAVLHEPVCERLRHWLRCGRWPLLMTDEERWLACWRLDVLYCLTAKLEHARFLPPVAAAVWRADEAVLCAAGWLRA